MDVLGNQAFQIIGIPIIIVAISQCLLLLGKRDAIGVSDFASVPYALGAAGLAINATFAINRPSSITIIYALCLILVFGMIAIELSQKLIPRLPIVVNIVCTAFGIALVSFTFLIWG